MNTIHYSKNDGVQIGSTPTYGVQLAEVCCAHFYRVWYASHTIFVGVPKIIIFIANFKPIGEIVPPAPLDKSLLSCDNTFLYT